MQQNKKVVHSILAVMLTFLIFHQVFGIKGLPIMALHCPFHLVYGTVKDILHCGYLGVVKALLVNHWFSQRTETKITTLLIR